MPDDQTAAARTASIVARLDRLPPSRYFVQLVALIAIGGWFEFYEFAMPGGISLGLTRRIYTAPRPACSPGTVLRASSPRSSSACSSAPSCSVGSPTGSAGARRSPGRCCSIPSRSSSPRSVSRRCDRRAALRRRVRHQRAAHQQQLVHLRDHAAALARPLHGVRHPDRADLGADSLVPVMAAGAAHRPGPERLALGGHCRRAGRASSFGSSAAAFPNRRAGCRRTAAHAEADAAMRRMEDRVRAELGRELPPPDLRPRRTDRRRAVAWTEMFGSAYISPHHHAVTVPVLPDHRRVRLHHLGADHAGKAGLRDRAFAGVHRDDHAAGAGRCRARACCSPSGSNANGSWSAPRIGIGVFGVLFSQARSDGMILLLRRRDDRCA